MTMRLTRTEEILSAAYTARIEVVEALQEVALGSDATSARLRAAAENLDATSGLYGDAPTARTYVALAELATCVTLAEWREAVLSAGADAQQFLIAAQERAATLAGSFDADRSFGSLATVTEQMMSLKSVSEVANVAASLAAIPLPVGLYSAEGSSRRSPRIPDEGGEVQAKPVELSVAFIKFTIDGSPLPRRITYLRERCMTSILRSGSHAGRSARLR